MKGAFPYLQRFHERGDARVDLSGIELGVIGLQRHIRHAQTAAELAERPAFDKIGVAARKGDIEHGVGVKFLDERGDHIEPAAVRRHHGAADGETGVGNGGENILHLGVYAAARRFDARAVFKADDLRARALRRAEHLLVYAADRAAGDEKPRSPCRR